MTAATAPRSARIEPVGDRCVLIRLGEGVDAGSTCRGLKSSVSSA